MALTLISHFYNESFLLPFWLRHHRRLFDHAVLIDYDSTDDSTAIIRQLAPDWEIRSSRNRSFDAALCDQEVMDVEREFDGWKMVLNTTEFLLHWDLRAYLHALESDKPQVMGVWTRPVTMVDTQATRCQDITSHDLFLQRRHGVFEGFQTAERARLLHRGETGRYEVGRHKSPLPDTIRDAELHLLWFCWSPFEQIKARKLQIQHRIPESDRVARRGYQHFVTEEQLEARFAEVSAKARPLEEDPSYCQALRRVEQLVQGE
jgi:hypothetical protein